METSSSANQPNNPTPPSGGAVPPSAPNPPAGNMPPSPPSAGGSTTDIPGSAKAWAIIGYLIPVLFFVPLITELKSNAFARFHASQQLNLLIFWLAAQVIGIVPLLGWLVAMVAWIFGIVLIVMGIISAAQGTKKSLPLIGRWELIH